VDGKNQGLKSSFAVHGRAQQILRGQNSSRLALPGCATELVLAKALLFLLLPMLFLSVSHRLIIKASCSVQM
jgi:hypothetical protein